MSIKFTIPMVVTSIVLLAISIPVIAEEPQSLHQSMQAYLKFEIYCVEDGRPLFNTGIQLKMLDYGNFDKVPYQHLPGSELSFKQYTLSTYDAAQEVVNLVNFDLQVDCVRVRGPLSVYVPFVEGSSVYARVTGLDYDSDFSCIAALNPISDLPIGGKRRAVSISQAGLSRNACKAGWYALGKEYVPVVVYFEAVRHEHEVTYYAVITEPDARTCEGLIEITRVNLEQKYGPLPIKASPLTLVSVIANSFDSESDAREASYCRGTLTVEH